MNIAQNFHGVLHQKAVFCRRIQVLALAIAPLLPPRAHVLDIGCGSGTLAKAIKSRRPDVRIEGIDVLVRPNTEIPVTPYDGETIPWPADSFDFAMFVDVLHHTDAPDRLMAEAKRVSRSGLIIKDHFREGLFADATLRFMDWFGNAQHGVRLPFNYLNEAEWHEIWARLDLDVDHITTNLGLYPWPFSAAFDRRLHFVARLS
jgi:SAM-dependent methyltransferase